MKPVRIGSRGSMLALAQTSWVKQQIESCYPDLQVEMSIIKTSGDRVIDRPIVAVSGKGVFTKEIEDALLNQTIDIAVHSMKDLPTELPDGLAIVAVPVREDARDVLVTKRSLKLADLPRGARLATGSLRRQAQLLRHRGDLAITPIRGNVDTRLRKLDDGEADGLIMAAAGLKRIGRADRIGEYLPDEICVSAVAQGALAIEARADGGLRELLGFLHDSVAEAETVAERALLRRLSGGCHVPIGARARAAGALLSMIAIVASPDGATLCKAKLTGATSEAEQLGERLAEELLKQGADKILAAS
ncbi:MAG TPA: hydroxymethylbilane synthase [Candidatus Limnocylindria bacterium]|nr:hydroxymethylbilane synthase [Candidatus Limnocylindria bacterium]